MGFFRSKRGFLTTSIVLVTLFLQSCSSLFYSDSLRKKNNTFTVNSNQPNYKVVFTKVGSSNVSNNGNEIQIDKLNRKRTFFTFSSPGCYDINIKVKRVPRVGAVLLDLPLSIFFLAPYAVDVFKPDFYKISNGSKNISLDFQRTNEYFREKMGDAVVNLDDKILDNLLFENPPMEIKSEIDNRRIQISKTILYSHIKSIITQNTIENYNLLINQFPQKIKECNQVLDSLKLSIQKSEISNIRKKSDLFRLIELKKISDSSFVQELNSIKPEIEVLVFQKILEEYDFKKLNDLSKLYSPNESTQLNNLRDKMELNSIEYLKKNNTQLYFLDELYSQVSEKTRKVYDSIRPSIVKNNDIDNLRKQLDMIKYEMEQNSFYSAIVHIKNIYPNQYPSTIPENVILKNYLNTAMIEDFINTNTKIVYTNGNLTPSEFETVFKSFNEIKSYNPTTSLQKTNIENIKNQLIYKRIQYFNNYVNSGGTETTEITSFINNKEFVLNATQKKDLTSLISICKKRESDYLKQQEEVRKQEEFARKEQSKVYSLNQSTVCDNLSDYINKNVGFVGFYSSSQKENQGWGLKPKSVNEEKMNSMTTWNIYDGNDEYYTRLVWLTDCYVILRIPYSLSNIPNITANDVQVIGEVVNSKKVIVKSLIRR